MPFLTADRERELAALTADGVLKSVKQQYYHFNFIQRSAMRIALVSPHTFPFSCGNSLLAERLRQGLVSRGHEVLLCGIDAATVESAASFSPDIVHSLHAIKPARWLEELFSRISVPWVITLTGTDYNSPQEYGAEYGMLERQFTQAPSHCCFS